jgi:hypothetical protein
MVIIIIIIIININLMLNLLVLLLLRLTLIRRLNIALLRNASVQMKSLVLSLKIAQRFLSLF